MDDDDDIFREPAVAPARPGGKFRPKAKPRPSKVASTAVASAVQPVPNVITEKTVTVSTTVSDTVPCIKSVGVGDDRLTNPVGSSLVTSGTLESVEPSKSNENICTNVPLSDGNKDTNPCEAAATVALQPEVAAMEGGGDCNSSVAKAAGENADIFSGLECLDGFKSQTTSSPAESVASKSHDKADVGTQHGDKFIHTESSAFRVCDVSEPRTCTDNCATQDPLSCIEVCVSNKQGELPVETERQVDGAFDDYEVVDVVPDATISSERDAGEFQSKLKIKKGKENLHIPRSEFESTTLSQAAHLVNSETSNMNETSAFPPGNVLDQPSPTLDSQVNKENLEENAHLDGTIFGDSMHSEDVGGRPGKAGHKSKNGKARVASNVHQKRKSVVAGEEAEGGTSSRQRRKRLPRQQVDELAHEANEDGITGEPCNDHHVSEDENNDDENWEQETSRRKRAPRKSKKPVSEKKEPVRKRKKANEAPDKSTEDPPKKFSHSTRRNKRHVDKSLLEIPEEEIDPQTLPIKDLIRLAEHRELLAIKEARKLKNPLPDESANDFHKEASHNEDETFPSEHDRSSDENQASYKVNPSSSVLNYQSYMDKAPTARWSKDDTELFYEAIQQCGSDFSTIQKLYFPGRTRHQVKLKFKKEERERPLRVSEALFRSTRSSGPQFISYLERVKQAVQANKESNGDEPVATTDKEEVEQTHDTDEGVGKPESEEHQDHEADVAEAHNQEVPAAEVNNSMKSDEIDDDDDFTWSE